MTVLQRLALGLFLGFAALAPAQALEPNEMLDDPALEARAQDIGKGLRCLVCQNESINDSSAGLARDLRVLVRERLTAGDSDDQAVDYIVDRYGDYVLLNPPFKAKTLALWLGPAALFLLALLGGAWILRRSRPRAEAQPAPGALTDAERRRLDGLLKDQQG